MKKIDRVKKIKCTKRYMFQRAAIYMAIILWLIAAVNVLWSDSNLWNRGSNSSNANQIITAFNEGTFMQMQAQISAYGEYGVVYLSQNAKETILKNMAKEIGITNYVIEETSDSDLENTSQNTFTTTLSQSGVHGDVICKIITVEKRVEQNVIQARQYVYSNVTLNNSIESAFAYEKIMKKIMKELEVDTKVTVNLKGEINGDLDMALKNSISDKLLSTIRAKVVAENKDENLYTVYAYASGIEDYITMGNNKINVNVSMSYDETKNITSVYLSTPINSEDY